MSHLSELLQKPEYIHVLINHLPITGLFVAIVVLIVGIPLRSRRTILLGLVLVALFSLSIWPVMEYGDAAADRVHSMVYAEGQAWLKYHEHLADEWSILYYITAGVSAIGLILGCLRKKSLWVTVPLVIVLALGSLVGGALIGDAGGKIMHSEFRIGPAPKVAPDDDADHESRAPDLNPLRGERLAARQMAGGM